MKLVLTLLTLLALTPTVAAADPLGSCSKPLDPDGVIVHCKNSNGRTTLYAARSDCLTETYVYVSGAWVWVYCQPIP